MNAPHTALVLGGGGSAGNAWLIGVAAGLADGGLDVVAADLTIGTSAGATAAAQLTMTTPAQLFDDTLAQAPPAPLPARPPLTSDHLHRMRAIIAASSNAADYRRRMAQHLAQSQMTTESWRATVASRLPRAAWQKRRILITAVNAATAEGVCFDAESGVDLVDAVAASTAGGFVYDIGGVGYIDGGFRSKADNADLASGYARVLVLSPLGGRSFTPAEWGTHLSTQLESLRASGSQVETIFPDASSLDAFGDNMMDPRTRPAAARAGFDQGRRAAPGLMKFWNPHYLT